MSVSRISFPIGPVRADRPFYVHTSLLSGSRVMSDMLFSPAASAAISGNSDIDDLCDNGCRIGSKLHMIGCPAAYVVKTDIPGDYDGWDEPEVPGIHFTYGDESDIPNCSHNWDCSCEYWASVANGTPTREH